MIRLGLNMRGVVLGCFILLATFTPLVRADDGEAARRVVVDENEKELLCQICFCDVVKDVKSEQSEARKEPPELDVTLVLDRSKSFTIESAPKEKSSNDTRRHEMLKNLIPKIKTNIKGVRVLDKDKDQSARDVKLPISGAWNTKTTGLSSSGLRRVRVAWQLYRKRGALLLGRSHQDFPTVRLHDFPDDKKTEPEA